MKQKLLQQTGALHQAAQRQAPAPKRARRAEEARRANAFMDPDPNLLALVPASVAVQHTVFPLRQEGDVLYLAAVNANDYALKDQLTFTLNRSVRLETYHRRTIGDAIKRHYVATSVDSYLQEVRGGAGPVYAYAGTAHGAADDEMLHDVEADFDLAAPASMPSRGGLVHFKKRPSVPHRISTSGGYRMFHYVVEEGQQVLMKRPDGSMAILKGPKRVFSYRRRFVPMQQHVAHPGEFLRLCFRDGTQQHLAGPAEVWFDPRVHKSIDNEDALQISAKEAVVVYTEGDDSQVTRRIVHGPAVFVPKPGEWLHTFSWHASKGGSQDAEKIANSLVFQKLWLMPDQMYHNVHEVRTGDDAVLTIKLMIFFELVDIERMLDTTRDPIGDFINATTSDVVDFVGRYDFADFKHNTEKLNEIETYRQLTLRAEQSGYRINKVVYRGYGAPESLQKMHDEAIEARTRLQLERATEEQTQNVENYKLDCQIDRSNKRRGEQGAEVDHEIDLAGRRQQAAIARQQSEQDFHRAQRQHDEELALEMQRRQHGELREHLSSLRDMGVDLTAYLTQGRADQVIELRGNSGSHHLHLAARDDQTSQNGE